MKESRIREIVRDEMDIERRVNEAIARDHDETGYSWEGKTITGSDLDPQPAQALERLSTMVVDHIEDCIQMVDDLAERRPLPTIHQFIVVCPDCGQHLMMWHQCPREV